MKKVAARVSVTTKIDADRFGEAAQTYAKHATKSKRAARETLVALGIYTKKGKLTKNYNSQVHTLSSTFILGYHGCDQAVAEKILSGDDIKPSQNDYDQLGPSIYFWEANPNRGLEYAHELKKLRRPPKIKKPAVIGAVVDLGLCLDLTTSAGIQQVRDAYKRLNDIFKEADWELPQNNKGLLRRNLDCAVIRLLHDIREQDGLPPIDTIKGVFIEGGPIYPDSGFYIKTHIQVCACTPESIKGVFRVPKRFLR